MQHGRGTGGRFSCMAFNISEHQPTSRNIAISVWFPMGVDEEVGGTPTSTIGLPERPPPEFVCAPDSVHVEKGGLTNV